MEYEVFIPIIPWLIGGSRIGGGYNYYTGSFGTDAKLGCMGKKIFNYRMWIEKIDEHEVIKVAVYYGVNSFEAQDPENVEIVQFELEEESRELAKVWVESKAKDFFQS